MKIRSKALWQFLNDRGLIGTAVDVAVVEAAKREYRKKYKQNWKQSRQIPIRELRPSFTQKQYHELRFISRQAGFKHPTTYIKQLVIASLTSKPLAPDLPRLQQILQLISMSANATPHSDILHAEDLLLHYIKEFSV